jgi:hypothetical protein
LYKIGEQEIKIGPVWEGLYQWEGGGGGERVCKGEYGANTVYTCMQMENGPVKTILGMGEGGDKGKWWRG